MQHTVSGLAAMAAVALGLGSAHAEADDPLEKLYAYEFDGVSLNTEFDAVRDILEAHGYTYRKRGSTMPGGRLGFFHKGQRGSLEQVLIVETWDDVAMKIRYRAVDKAILDGGAMHVADHPEAGRIDELYGLLCDGVFPRLGPRGQCYAGDTYRTAQHGRDYKLIANRKQFEIELVRK